MKKLSLLLLFAFAVLPARADEIDFKFGTEFSWSLPLGAAPDQGSAAANDFTFLQIPVATSVGVHTFDLHFFELDGRTDFIMTCDPFGFNIEDPAKTCDYFNRLELNSLSGIWTRGASGNPHFIPGDYNGFVISQTAEPSVLALLLGSALAVSLLRRRTAVALDRQMLQ